MVSSVAPLIIKSLTFGTRLDKPYLENLSVRTSNIPRRSEVNPSNPVGLVVVPAVFVINGFAVEAPPVYGRFVIEAPPVYGRVVVPPVITPAVVAPVVDVVVAEVVTVVVAVVFLTEEVAWKPSTVSELSPIVNTGWPSASTVLVG